MCECCAQHAAGHHGHVHVNGVDCEECFKKLEQLLQDTPGLVSVEYAKDTEQAKVVFDRRILEITALEQLLDNNGFAVS